MRYRDIGVLLLAIVIAQSAGFVGSLFTAPAIDSWYNELIKPALNPPDWVFGPVWFTLYTLMGIAAFLVWRSQIPLRQKRVALLLFSFQLVLNALWSALFFGAREIGWAFDEILLLWAMIVLTTITFYKISKPAAYLLVPYLAWVSFAAYLNYAIWTLN